jgi:hypothetical protein
MESTSAGRYGWASYGYDDSTRGEYVELAHLLQRFMRLVDNEEDGDASLAHWTDLAEEEASFQKDTSAREKFWFCVRARQRRTDELQRLIRLADDPAEGDRYLAEWTALAAADASWVAQVKKPRRVWTAAVDRHTNATYAIRGLCM